MFEDSGNKRYIVLYGSEVTFETDNRQEAIDYMNDEISDYPYDVDMRVAEVIKENTIINSGSG